eukprot:1015471-Prorocentrum_minimum.AAC.1
MKFLKGNTAIPIGKFLQIGIPSQIGADNQIDPEKSADHASLTRCAASFPGPPAGGSPPRSFASLGPGT